MPLRSSYPCRSTCIRRDVRRRLRSAPDPPVPCTSDRARRSSRHSPDSKAYFKKKSPNGNLSAQEVGVPDHVISDIHA